MSRLESMMRRLAAQKIGLEWCVEQTKDIIGDLAEIGLGNGRSYDHLREIAPDRKIWVLDRVLQCHPSCIPPAGTFLQGEASEVIAQMKRDNIGIALAHYDFGVGIKDKDEAEAAALSPLIRDIMVKDGLLISGQPLVGFTQIEGPAEIPAGRYYFYKT
ncbi:hypothetical protein F9L33_04395 [Amylibacter sp. SFDW26]|uniref:class I SAM-dependent methyltransferase n=1 Tax=Amylibacter sp. SFDW26 TaxID=2652722 RepID=UPI0012625592|nr:class I SAM-dependent methyltransferase [Amylibacter sp. SFDW26]KAB7616009.1 hypothetical protein F9L33_04395 [Amylibacter sp. SFDW26]